MTLAEARTILGVAEDSDPLAIRLAYRERAKTAHPDAGGDAYEFQQLTGALRLAVAEAIITPCPNCRGSGRTAHTSGIFMVKTICMPCEGSGRRWPQK